MFIPPRYQSHLSFLWINTQETPIKFFIQLIITWINTRTPYEVSKINFFTLDITFHPTFKSKLNISFFCHSLKPTTLTCSLPYEYKIYRYHYSN